MTENYKKDLTYEIIRDAVNGNDEAEEFILDYYEPYIIKLSKKAQKVIKMVKKIIRKMRLKYGNRMTYLCLNF